MKTWSSYFDAVALSLYSETLRLAPLIELVMKYIELARSKKILEAGCGTGTTSFLLGEMGFEVLGIDLDPQVVHRVREKSPYFLTKASYKVADMCDIQFPDKHFGVTFSQGVHEHFADELILRSVREQLRVSDYVIIDVPNSRYGQRNFGDERLMPPAWWKQMFDQAGARLIEERGRMLRRWTRFLPNILHNHNRRARLAAFSKYVGINSLFVLASSDST